MTKDTPTAMRKKEVVRSGRAILEIEAVQQLMMAWRDNAVKRKGTMDKILEAEKRGGEDVDYLEDWVREEMTEDDVEERLDDTRIDDEYNPTEWESAFVLVMRTIKTARVNRYRNEEYRRRTTKLSMTSQNEKNDRIGTNEEKQKDEEGNTITQREVKTTEGGKKTIKTRSTRYWQCEPCKRDNYGVCKYCLDMQKSRRHIRR